MEAKPLDQIIKDLSKPIPKEWLKNKNMGGSNITFCPWYRVAHLMDTHAPGWQKQITNTIITGTHIIHTVRVSITAAEGTFFREATGIEELKVTGYGDASSNAESMAFRRACANWGLGAHLYEKDDVSLDHGDEPAQKPAAKKALKPSGDGHKGEPPVTHGQKIEDAKAYLDKAAASTVENWAAALGKVDDKIQTWPAPHGNEIRRHANALAAKRGEEPVYDMDDVDAIPFN